MSEEKTMLLFVDESGQDRSAPYEILAGVAIHEQDLWNLIQAIQNLELEIFGLRLAEVGIEIKGKKLLKAKTFRHARQIDEIDAEDRRNLCLSFLQKGYREFLGGPIETRSRAEFTAYGQAVLEFVRRLYDLMASFRVKTFASIVEQPSYPLPSADILRKDYSRLFERFFYYLEDIGTNEMGIIVFDELEKAKCRILINQMEQYFVKTGRGYTRSARIIPEPFFVHSDLTTAVQLADIIAYSLNLGIRLNRMTKPIRPEMEEFGQYAFDLKYAGRRLIENEEQPRIIYGITYIDDLRPRVEKAND